MAEPIDQRLQPLRDAIDRVDAQLVELLNERARLASEVGRLKGEVDAPVLRTEREAEVVRKVAAASRGPLSAAALANVFREIMSACRALERPLTVKYIDRRVFEAQVARGAAQQDLEQLSRERFIDQF